MERYSAEATIWLPGRMKHIFNDFGKVEDLECGVCNGISSLRESQSHLLYSGKHCIVTHSPTPYCIGHLLIIPMRHICTVRDFLDCESLDVIKVQQICQEILDEVVHPHSYDIGISSGIINADSSLRHIVYHMVPRKKGDKNLMQLVKTAQELRFILRDATNALHREFANRTQVNQTNVNMSI